MPLKRVLSNINVTHFGIGQGVMQKEKLEDLHFQPQLLWRGHWTSCDQPACHRTSQHCKSMTDLIVNTELKREERDHVSLSLKLPFSVRKEIKSNAILIWTTIHERHWPHRSS